MSTIKDGALKAVAASRPNRSKSDIISEPSERMVKESGDTYCDNTGVKTNLIPAGQAPGGLGLFVSRGKPESHILLALHVVTSALQMFLIPRRPFELLRASREHSRPKYCYPWRLSSR
jgi:hypothetical protein